MGMNVLMGSWFMIFWFTKLINVSGFVKSFRQYDIITMNFPLYWYAYPVIEFSLGVAYIADSMMIYWLPVNLVTLCISSMTIIGILRSFFSSDEASLCLSRSPYGPHSRLGHTCRVWKYDYYVSRHDTSHDEYYLNLFLYVKTSTFFYIYYYHIYVFLIVCLSARIFTPPLPTDAKSSQTVDVKDGWNLWAHSRTSQKIIAGQRAKSHSL